MSDPMSKEDSCIGCKYYHQSYTSYPCDQCKRGYHWREIDMYSEIVHADVYAGEDIVNEAVDPAKELAEAHWSYVEALLNAHELSDDIIEIAKFHYISAFVHGYKHAMEDYGE